jgi:putative Mg2+ transporter-C (MgtC) family protein
MEAILIGRILVAALFGALLGLERSIAGKHAGMRTYALVSLGSAFFVGVSIIGGYQLASFGGINPLQVAANVVLGVGFIGAGLAAFRGDHPVELTTASGLWVAAGIGMACGFGLFTTALAVTVLGILIFSVLAKVEYRLSRRLGTKHEE